MTLAILFSRANTGIEAPLVTVEVHIPRGMPKFNIVGLPEAAVRESRDRVRSALVNSGFDFPARRITVNLAPADLPKEGGRFDLPIAIGVLVATGQLPANKLSDHEFVGELALSGELRSIKGVLPVVLGAHAAKRILIVPTANEEEASLVKKANVYHAQHLLQVCAYLKDEENLLSCQINRSEPKKTFLDLSDVKGQPHAKRALEIAAAGKHNLLFIGPPGTGKTMLASRIPTILPNLNDEEALEVAAIKSVSLKGFDAQSWNDLPFRSPHHSCSSVAIVGGGRPPRPGEISLAHKGILFLDELPEFNRQVLECLREPIESGCVTISRASYQTQFPANFQLIAAMNPCPCGYAGSHQKECQCTHEQVIRYINKLSGPLLDRIDMQVEVRNLSPHMLSEYKETPNESLNIKEKVINAGKKQIQRQQKFNKDLNVKELETYCSLDNESKNLLNRIMDKFNLSARIYHRIIKVSRTIADLSASEYILQQHISEALSFRCLDRSKITSERLS